MVSIRRWGVVGAFALALIVAGTSGARAEIFIRIDQLGQCGSSLDAAHPNDIEVSSIALTLERAPGETGLPAGPQDRGLTFTKMADGCSPLLLIAALSKQRLRLRAFFTRQNDTAQDIMTLDASSVEITKLSVAGVDGGFVNEQIIVGLRGRLTVTVRSQLSGGGLGPPVTRCWNFGAEQPC